MSWFRNERIHGGLRVVLVAVLLLAPLHVAAQGDSSGDLPVIPPEIEQFASEWPLPNRDYANTRATMDSEIDSSNVETLGPAWIYDITGIGPFGGAASNPLIVDGVVYFQDLASNVVALDLETGDEVWFAEFGEPVLGPNGLAIGYATVIINSSVDSFAGLDLETGERLWERSTDMRPTGAFQGVFYNGIAFMTTQAGIAGQGDVAYRGYEGGTSGNIMALDPETGETIWEFQVVEEDFWGNPELNSGGGVWFPPAIDTETGITYWGTGNPAPFPGTVDFPNAASRPGPNLYTNALLAFEHDTGEMVWYNQVKPHDIFDADFQLSPILAEATIDGEERAIVVSSGKLGRMIAFDRQSGDILWDTPVGMHQNDELEEVPMGEVVEVYPGVLGGVETPMALADGVVFAAVNNLPTPYTATGWDAKNGTEAVGRAEARTALNEGTSEAVALDINTGEILWSTEFDNLAFGGMTVVNDLVFTGLFEGRIVALAREDGRVLWEYQAPGGIIAWPAVAGDMLIYPAGLGDSPALVALRLGAAGEDGEQGGGTPVPTPWG